MQTSLIARLDVRDRELFQLLVIDASQPRWSTAVWRVLTHIGGLWMSVAAVFVPLVLDRVAPRALFASVQAGLALLLSHLVVQVIKRRVIRERPHLRVVIGPHVVVPDKFSFPSGHSCAVMSVAFVHAVTYPWLAWPLLLIPMLVGLSRVRLGVHYPGDVFAGQAIAIATGILVMGLL